MFETKPTRTSPLVLIVDSEAETREMYTDWFLRSGFHVVTSDTGEEAIEKARTFRPDVVQTDIRLRSPMDGCGLLRALKRDARTKSIPVVAVSPRATGGYVERAREAGCDAVLVNPCRPDTLLAAVLPLLKSARQKFAAV